MVMRYHWGLGIGHKYSHGQGNELQEQNSDLESSDVDNEEAPPKLDANVEVVNENNNPPKATALHYNMENQHNNLHETQPRSSNSDNRQEEVQDQHMDYNSAVDSDSDSDSSNNSNGYHSGDDEEELIELYETYYVN